MHDIPECVYCHTGGPDEARKWGLCRNCYRIDRIRVLCRDGKLPPAKTVKADQLSAACYLNSRPLHSHHRSTPLAAIKIETEQEKHDRELEEELDKLSIADEEAKVNQIISEQLLNLPDWWEKETPEPDQRDILARIMAKRLVKV